MVESLTLNQFRKLALSLPEVNEFSHHGHPDFRVRGIIFATLGYPHKARGKVKLTPNMQEFLIRTHPEAFVRVNGTWGLRGATGVLLRHARKATLEKALADAWHHNAPKQLIRHIDIRE